MLYVYTYTVYGNMNHDLPVRQHLFGPWMLRAMLFLSQPIQATSKTDRLQGVKENP